MVPCPLSERPWIRYRVRFEAITTTTTSYSVSYVPNVCDRATIYTRHIATINVAVSGQVIVLCALNTRPGRCANARITSTRYNSENIVAAGNNKQLYTRRDGVQHRNCTIIAPCREISSSSDCPVKNSRP
jgi:hypothetical protein